MEKPPGRFTRCVARGGKSRFHGSQGKSCASQGKIRIGTLRQINMNQRNTREWMRNWDTTEFLNEQRKNGRSGLSPAFLQKYAAEHDRIAELLENSDISAQDMKLARMLEAITAPLAALHAN